MNIVENKINQSAIILTVFGSVIEHQKYQDLKKIVEGEFPDCDVYLAVSSVFILKALLKMVLNIKTLHKT